MKPCKLVTGLFMYPLSASIIHTPTIPNPLMVQRDALPICFHLQKSCRILMSVYHRMSINSPTVLADKMYQNVVNSKCPSNLFYQFNPSENLRCQETNGQINKTKGNKDRHVLRRMREKNLNFIPCKTCFPDTLRQFESLHGSHEPYRSMIYIC